MIITWACILNLSNFEPNWFVSDIVGQIWANIATCGGGGGGASDSMQFGKGEI